MKTAWPALAAATLLLVAAARASTAVTAPNEALTLPLAYRYMAAAMTRDGAVMHTTIATRMDAGGGSYDKREDVWSDAASAAVRRDIETEFGAEARIVQRGSSIMRGDDAYVSTGPGSAVRHEALVCRGAPDAVVSAQLGCRGFLEQSSTQIDTGATFDGRDAIAIVSDGTSRGRGDRTSFRDTLYVDAATYLPVALVTDGVVDDGAAQPFHSTARYAHEFVTKDAFVGAIFDPSTIGYRERSARSKVTAARGAVYGLGEAPRAAALPALSLTGVSVTDASAARFTAWTAELVYSLADAPYGNDALVVRTWRANAWAQSAHDDTLRHVTLGDAVIEMQALDPALATPEATAAVIAALRRQ